MKLTENQIRRIVSKLIKEQAKPGKQKLDLRFFQRLVDNSPDLPSVDELIEFMEMEVANDKVKPEMFYYINFDTADTSSYDLGGGPDGDDYDISMYANDYWGAVLNVARKNAYKEDNTYGDVEGFDMDRTSIAGYYAVLVGGVEPTVIVYLGVKY